MEFVNKFDYQKLEGAINQLIRSKRYVDRRDGLMLAIGTYTSLRVSDFRMIRWDQLVDINGEIYPELTVSISKSGRVQQLIEQKTKKRRQVVIGKSLHRAIQAAWRASNKVRDEYLFRRLSGGSIDGPMTRQAAWKIVNKRAAQFGLGPGGTHSLRKTGAYEIYKRNGETHTALMIVSKALNHENTQVTMTYLGINRDRVFEVYSNL